MKEIEIYFSEIKKNCKQICNIYANSGKFLYSGKKSSDDFIVLNEISNRKPKDTSNEIQNLFDEILTELGFVARRSNSLFTTGNQAEAKRYGNIYIVFPYDDFHFTWSPKVRDLYGNMRNFFGVMNRVYKDQNEWAFYIGEPKKDFFETEFKYYYIENNKKEALEKLKSIIRKHKNLTKEQERELDSCYTLMDVREKHFFIFDFVENKNEEMKKEIRDWVEKYSIPIWKSEEFKDFLTEQIKRSYKKDDIVAAIDSWNEVLIKAKKYILISEKHSFHVENFLYEFRKSKS